MERCKACGRPMPFTESDLAKVERKIALANRKLDEAAVILEAYEGDNSNLEEMMSNAVSYLECTIYSFDDIEFQIGEVREEIGYGE